MKSPKFIALDTRTLGNLARDWKTNSDAKDVVSLLNSGEHVPYLTWHHIEELLQHGDSTVYQERLTFLHALKFISFSKECYDPNGPGTFLDLRDFEIRTVLEGQTQSNQELIDKVRPVAIGGFTSGKELCTRNVHVWDEFRAHHAERMLQQRAEIASIKHFPTANPKMRLPNHDGGYSVMSPDEARAYFDRVAGELGEKLLLHGDKRLRDPKKLAKDFLDETFQDSLALIGGDGALEKLLGQFDIDFDRLPKNARLEDASYEALFNQTLNVHARRINRDIKVLREKLRQEYVPSWIIWRELDRRLKQLPNASASDMNDVTIAAFGLYVDYIEVDKRVADLIRQAASQTLFKLLQSRLVRYSSYKDLAKLLT